MGNKKSMSVKATTITFFILGFGLDGVYVAAVQLPYTLTSRFDLPTMVESLGMCFVGVAITLWSLVDWKLIKWTDRIPLWWN